MAGTRSKNHHFVCSRRDAGAKSMALAPNLNAWEGAPHTSSSPTLHSAKLVEPHIVWFDARATNYSNSPPRQGTSKLKAAKHAFTSQDAMTQCNCTAIRFSYQDGTTKQLYKCNRAEDCEAAGHHHQLSKPSVETLTPPPRQPWRPTFCFSIL